MGRGLGPIIASLVYRHCNYECTFFFFASFIFILGLIARALIPARVNSSQHDDIQQENFEKLGLGIFSRDTRSTMALILLFQQVFCTVVFDPVLSIRLVNLGLSPSNAGFAFGLMAFA